MRQTREDSCYHLRWLIVRCFTCLHNRNRSTARTAAHTVNSHASSKREFKHQHRHDSLRDSATNRGTPMDNYLRYNENPARDEQSDVQPKRLCRVGDSNHARSCTGAVNSAMARRTAGSTCQHRLDKTLSSLASKTATPPLN